MLSEQEKANELIEIFLKTKQNYINLSEDNKYLGWVSNFNISLSDGSLMKLNLKEEEDLFLLFVLAVAWSRTGRWENAAYFVTYLKVSQKYFVEYWLDNFNIVNEQMNREQSVKDTLEEVTGLTSRIKVSFRNDTFDSIHILAKNWNEIKSKLNEANLSGNYVSFMNYMRGVKGLGVKDKSMMIKIPLILRELRCQNIYRNIPGELCCVPDERVKIAYKKLLDVNLPLATSLDGLIKASTKIYELFGDLYDLPLFAYEDIK